MIPILVSGTKILVEGNTAPVGWTKDTSITNGQCLRVVNGIASSGGEKTFTEVFQSFTSSDLRNSGFVAYTNIPTIAGSLGSTTLSLSTIASHAHSINNASVPSTSNFVPPSDNFAPFVRWGYFNTAPSAPYRFETTGGGLGHSHPFGLKSPSLTGDSFILRVTGDFRLRWKSVIVAIKN